MVSGICAVASLIGCAAGGHYRFVDPKGETWAKEVSDYPKIVLRTDQRFPAADPGGVRTYFSPVGQPAFRKVGSEGTVGPPPADLQILADLKIIRGPRPDHEGACAELRTMAARLGATALTEVRCTVILGETYVGGAEIVGWTYEGHAARAKGEAP
jgi:hypothetical protein